MDRTSVSVGEATKYEILKVNEMQQWANQKARTSMEGELDWTWAAAAVMWCRRLTWADLSRRTSSPPPDSTPPQRTELRCHSSLPLQSGTLPRLPGRSPPVVGSSKPPDKRHSKNEHGKHQGRRLQWHHFQAYPAPLVVPRVVSVQQVTGSLSSVVPAGAAARSVNEPPQHRQAMVAPLRRQLGLHLPDSRLAVESTDFGAQLLPALEHLNREEEKDEVSST